MPIDMITCTGTQLQTTSICSHLSKKATQSDWPTGGYLDKFHCTCNLLNSLSQHVISPPHALQDNIIWCNDGCSVNTKQVCVSQLSCSSTEYKTPIYSLAGINQLSACPCTRHLAVWLGCSVLYNTIPVGKRHTTQSNYTSLTLQTLNKELKFVDSSALYVYVFIALRHGCRNESDNIVTATWYLALNTIICVQQLYRT